MVVRDSSLYIVTETIGYDGRVFDSQTFDGQDFVYECHFTAAESTVSSATLGLTGCQRIAFKLSLFEGSAQGLIHSADVFHRIAYISRETETVACPLALSNNLRICTYAAVC